MNLTRLTLAYGLLSNFLRAITQLQLWMLLNKLLRGCFRDVVDIDLTAGQLRDEIGDHRYTHDPEANEAKCAV